jgi:hypothetical protein
VTQFTRTSTEQFDFLAFQNHPATLLACGAIGKTTQMTPGKSQTQALLLEEEYDGLHSEVQDPSRNDFATGMPCNRAIITTTMLASDFYCTRTKPQFLIILACSVLGRAAHTIQHRNLPTSRGVA